MRSNPFAAVLAALALLSAAPAANAQLLGASVTGQMLILGGPPNFFDPVNGFVPAGYSNTAGTTVTIAEPAIEFGYQDSWNTDTANFTPTQLIFTDVSNGGSVPVTYTFSSSAFVGATLSEDSDSFPVAGVSASLSGDTITLNAPNFGTSGTFQSVYTITQAGAAAPEPGSLALLTLAGVPVVGLARRRGTSFPSRK